MTPSWPATRRAAARTWTAGPPGPRTRGRAPAALASKAAAAIDKRGWYETRVLPVDKVVEHEVKSRTVAQATPTMSPTARALFDRFVASTSSVELADDVPGVAELLTLKLIEAHAWGGRQTLNLSRHGYNVVKSERGVASGKLRPHGSADLVEQATDFAASAKVED